MNDNFRKFIRDIDKMSPDKEDSITYQTLKTLADKLMLDELLCGEADPVDFLIETLLEIQKESTRNMLLSRLERLEKEGY